MNIEAPEVVPAPAVPEMSAPNIFNTQDTAANSQVSPVDNLNLEATFELPKMANDIINSDITATKSCPSCGHVNEYTNKTCVMCGSNLE